MAHHNEIGDLGEAIAISFLEDHEYQIKAHNWRLKRFELDIVAMKDDILVFVEVKTRQNQQFGQPEEAVTTKKEQMLIQAAGLYCETIDYESEIRFDIIAITLEPKLEIVHFKDAFFPGWDQA